VNIRILRFKDTYRDELIDVWERSVRATHDFLKPGEIDKIKILVLGIDFNSFDVYCIFDDEDKMVGILGVADKKLEMLFLAPESIGKGVGRKLMEFVLQDLQVNAVDVNEDNTSATSFYKKFGFKVYERTPFDDHGQPYPILKMKL
jgi:putative acetyltransferase